LAAQAETLPWQKETVQAWQSVEAKEKILTLTKHQIAMKQGPDKQSFSAEWRSPGTMRQEPAGQSQHK